MKFLKIFSSMLIATAMCCFISACSDDDDDPVKTEDPTSGNENPNSGGSTGSDAIQVSVSTLSFDTEGGAQTVSVTASSDWTASGPDWITIDPDSADGDATVTVTAESNYSEEGSEARTGSLTFTLTSGEGSATVTVSQDGSEVLSVDVTELDFTCYGRTKTVNVTASGDWTASGPDWATVEPSSGSGDAEVSVTVPDQHSDEGSTERTGTLTFSLTSGEGDAAVGLTQYGNDAAGPLPSGVYYMDDFEWVRPYAESVNQQDVVSTNQYGTFGSYYAYDVYLNDLSCQEDLLHRGYTVKHPSGSDVQNVIVMPAYLLFYCNNVDHMQSLHLPKLTNVPQDGDEVWFDLQWCPSCGKSINPDTVCLTVVITTGDTVVQVDAEESKVSDYNLYWSHHRFKVEGVTITEDTDICIRPIDKYWEQTSGTNRRYLVGGVTLYNSAVYTPED